MSIGKRGRPDDRARISRHPLPTRNVRLTEYAQADEWRRVARRMLFYVSLIGIAAVFFVLMVRVTHPDRPQQTHLSLRPASENSVGLPS